MENNPSKELLYGALSRLLHQKSIDKLSLKDIIEESGVCRATFYRYYSALPIQALLHSAGSFGVIGLTQCNKPRSEKISGET